MNCIDCNIDFEPIDGEDWERCPECYQEYIEATTPKHPDDKG